MGKYKPATESQGFDNPNPKDKFTSANIVMYADQNQSENERNIKLRRPVSAAFNTGGMVGFSQKPHNQ